MKYRYLIASLVPLMALASSAGAQTVTRGAYLQNGNTTAITVRWRTGTAADSVVRYGTSAASLTQSVSITGTRTEHEVRLTGLAPDTQYFYSIGTSSATLAGDATYFFVTSPTSAKPTRVWVLGDSGIGGSVQTNVRNAYFTFTGTRHTDLWMMLGDNAYNSGTDSEYTSYLFNYYPTMLRKSVLWPTLGNHDAGSADSPTQTGPYYAQHTLPKSGEAGGVASGTEAYYSYDYGNIHFICLDSADTSLSATGAMANWVTSDLQNNTKDWTIVFFHHPPYSKGSHNSDSESQLVSMRTNFNPIFENYGVDLVLSGHSHSYERSRLLDGHYGLSTTFNSATMVKQAGSGAAAGAYTKTAVGPVAHQGTIYAVPGASGQTSGGTLNHPAMWISLNVAGSMVLDFNNNRLDAIYLDSTGAQRDNFSMIKGGGTGNILPTVSISSPANGASFTAPAAITINATAADSDGTVSSVAFYQGGTLLGTDTTSPYSIAWSNVAAGSYNLTAIATDNAGGIKTSTAVSVSVNNPGNVSPTVGITSPVSGATFTAPASITINATAADSDGTVTSVDFYQGTTFLGSDTTSPYSFIWSSVAAGSYSLTARATDNGGAVTTSAAIPVAVNAAGGSTVVSLQNGTNGYNGMVDTHIRADATTTTSGSATTLLIDGSPDYSALLKWDLSSIPVGKTVTAVTLTFNVVDATSHVYELYALKRDWDETAATWVKATGTVNWATAGGSNTTSDRETTILGTLSSAVGTKTIILNAAGIAKVQSWVNTPATNYGFIVQDYTVSNGVDLTSSEGATVTQRPKITVTYQ